MKKELLFLVFALFMPFMVNAESCDENKIKFESIKLESIVGNAQEKSSATINGRKINLDLRMSKVGDSALYSVHVKNESEDEYLLDESSLLEESNYISYSLELDSDKILKPGEDKLVYFRVNYNKPVAASDFKNGVYQDNRNLVVNLSTDNEVVESNPATGKNLLILTLPFLILVGSTVFFKNKKTKYMLFFVTFALPFTVHAFCNINLNVESDVTIVKTEQFRLRIYGCFQWVDDTFEFEEGMTIKEWIESSYIQKFIDEKIEEYKTNPETADYYVNLSDEEIAEKIRNRTLDDIVSHITHDENYVIQANDFLDYYSPLC